MKRILCGLILCSSLLLSPCFSADQNDKQPVKVADSGKATSDSNQQIILKGVVLDEYSYKPLPHLGIYKDSAGNKVTVSDDKGEFEYPVPPGSEYVQILPWSTKVVGRSTFVKVSDFKNRKLSIFVERGMSVGVHVKDENGKPIPNASILWMGAGGATGTTDKHGSAILTQVSRFRSGWMSVKCAGYADWNSKDEEIYAPLYINGGYNVVMKKPDSTGPANNPEQK